MAPLIKLDFFSDFYDFPALEAKLREMAAQGLWLRTVLPLGIALFDRCPPGEARYALEPVRQGEGTAPSNEHVSFCRSQGWAYVATVSSLFRVYLCTDPDAPDFYSDADTKSRALGPMLRRMAATFAGCTLLLALYVLLLALLCARGTFWLALVKEPLAFLFAPVVVVWWFLSAALQLRKGLRRRRELSLGRPVRASLIPRKRAERLATALLSLALLLVLASHLYSAAHTALIPLTSGDQAPVSLQALEGTELELEAHYRFMDRDEGSYCKTWVSPLATVTECDQYGRLPGGEGVSLSITRYRLAFPALAGGVLDGLINSWGNAPTWRREGLLVSRDVPGAQRFYALGDGGVQQLFFAAGGCAVEIFYNGDRDLTPLYSQLVAQLRQ